MPHTSSAEKRHRQDEKRRLRNRGRVRAIKKQIKSFEELLKSGSADDLKKAYNTAAKLLDKSAAKRNDSSERGGSQEVAARSEGRS